MSLDKNARVELETARCDSGEKASATDRCGEPVAAYRKQAIARADHKDLADRLGNLAQLGEVRP